MIMLKACPRCQGDMNATRDMYGAYRECLQCGYTVDIPAEVPASLRPLTSVRVRATRATQR